jgi:transcriptional regulator of heat shock response
MSAQEQTDKLRTLVQQNGALMTKVAQESTLLTESQVIQSAIQNIDLSSVESKVDEVKQAVDDIDLTPIENKVQEGVNILSSKIDNIDLSAVEAKVETEADSIEAKIDEGVSTLADKIDNIKLPEIDTTELAKQGDDPEATNSKILEEVAKIPDLKNIYSARFEKNDDGEDTYSMVLPIVSGVIANEDGETVTIKL